MAINIYTIFPIDMEEHLKVEELLRQQSRISLHTIEIVIKYLRRSYLRAHKHHFQSVYDGFIDKLLFLNSTRTPGYTIFVDFRHKYLNTYNYFGS